MAIAPRLFGIAATLAILGSAGPVSAATDPTGVWLNDTGRGAIEIVPCGNGLCGTVVWVSDQKDADGCGKQIIGDAVEVQRGVWDGGWIYSPERKRRYDVELKPLDDQRLQVTGYAGSKFFSKQMIWTRAPADLARCSSRQAAATPAPEPAPGAAPAAGATARNESNQPSQPSSGSMPAPTAVPSPAQSPATANAPAEAKPSSPEPGQRERRERKRFALSDLPVDKFVKRLPNGDCRIDTPWAQVQFPCEKR